MINSLRRYRFRLILLLLLLLLIGAGLYLRSITPVAPPPVPSLPQPIIRPEFSSPQSVIWTDLPPTPLPATTSLYRFLLPDAESTAPQIASAFGFTTPPSRRDSPENPLLIWTQPPQSLVINLETNQITYTHTQPEYSIAAGQFQSPDQLTTSLINQIKKLNLYDPKISFTSTQIQYRTVDGAHSGITTADKANLVTVILAPGLDQTLFFSQEQPLIIGFFDRTNRLTQLKITHPIAQIEAPSTVSLLSFDQLVQLPADRFFQIRIVPRTNEEAFIGPQPLSQLQPNQVSLGYLIDSANRLLQPIFLLARAQDAITAYQYAALAYPTQ